MKRLVVALFVSTAVFGAIYGLASSLGVSSSKLGAGNSSIVACQAGTLTASYATVYDAAIPGYKVGVVTVTGLDTVSATNCASKAFKIALTNASNASLGEITGTTPASGTSFTADFTTSNVPAATTANVHVVITG